MTLVNAVAEMSDIHVFARVGRRALAYTALMSALAVVLGLVMVNVFEPGAGVDERQALKVLSESSERARGIVSEVGPQPEGVDIEPRRAAEIGDVDVDTEVDRGFRHARAA